MDEEHTPPVQPDDTPGPCYGVGHDLVHETAAGGEQITCGRPGCSLEVRSAPGVRCLHTAYRTWDRPQGLLDRTAHG